jgi:23S rRNA (cytosine1962-C5)-methyltransferase
VKHWRLTKPLRGAIRAGHPWIYDRALAPPKELRAGDIVTVADEDGPLCTVLADPESPIRARVLDLDVTRAIDAGWIRSRTEAAAARRVRDPLLVGCTGMRLVHGEGDACPGLVIDHYDTTAVVVFDGAAASAFWRPRLADAIAGLERGGVTIEHVWVRGERGQRAQGSAWRGDPPELIAISEDGARFNVDVRNGQKTGFFLDQRDNRRMIHRHALGASVLNVFSYTGGFSIHAALGGARAVTSVDIAAPAITALEANLVLSGVDPGAHESASIDAFDFFARSQKRGRRWDLVIVDPPSFAPSEKARPAALAAYKKLAIAALGVTEPGGRFALASCSSHVTEADLLDLVSGIGHTLRLRLAGGAGSDHPVLPAFPEGRYLKFLLFDVA